MYEKAIIKGSFGVVYYQGNNTIVKCSYRDDKSKRTLQNEIHVLKRIKGKPGFPIIHSYVSGSHIIMKTVGQSLDELLEQCQGKFTMKTSLMIAYQMFKRISLLHEKNLVHQDIKPENFCMNESNTLYCIDFGLTAYKNKERASFVGTERYASRNALRGDKISLIDDNEAIFYTLAYMYYGNLPWQGYKDDGTKQQKVLNKKEKHGEQIFASDFPKSIKSAFLKLGTHSSLWMSEQIIKALRSLSYVYDYDFDFKTQKHFKETVFYSEKDFDESSKNSRDNKIN